MSIFNNFQKSEVKYLIINQNKQDIYPIAFFDSIKKYPSHIKRTKCPAVYTVSNRFFYVNSFAELKIEFGYKEGKEYFNYEFDTTIHSPSSLMHNFINENCFLSYQDNLVHFQLGSPYAFVTDDNELEVTTIPPQIKYENCTFVPGALKPANWIRQLNSAFIINDINKPAFIYFSIDKPMLNFYFNKPINLNYSEYTDKIQKYHSVNKYINNYRKKLNNIYDRALLFRPKKLL